MKISTFIQNGIYFHSDTSSFSYVAFCLADGLHQLGIPIHSNTDFSHYSSNFRFKASKDSSVLNKCCCAVMGLEDTCEQNPYRLNYIEQIHDCTVALCMHDNLSNFLIDPSTPMLCTHENRFREVKGVRIPIAFGLSQTLISQTLNLAPFHARSDYVLRSFRPSLRQDVRACLDLALVPALHPYIPVETRFTHEQSDFLNLLAKSRYCLSYGGCFSQNLCVSPTFQAIDACREFYSHLTFARDTVVTRWDSWRFWESLVSGCVTIHLDFDLYGFLLPVMPENWKHYIGLDLANINRDVERMLDEQNRMEEIAYNGRLWAIENYSPVAVARRFLKTIQLLYPER